MAINVIINIKTLKLVLRSCRTLAFRPAALNPVDPDKVRGNRAPADPIIIKARSVKWPRRQR